MNRGRRQGHGKRDAASLGQRSPGSIHDPRERGVINFPFNPEGTHTVDAFVGSERAASLSSSPLFAVTLTSLSNAGHIGRGAKQNALF